MFVNPRDNVSRYHLVFPPGDTPYLDPYGEAPPERRTTFQVPEI